MGKARQEREEGHKREKGHELTQEGGFIKREIERCVYMNLSTHRERESRWVGSGGVGGIGLQVPHKLCASARHGTAPAGAGARAHMRTRRAAPFRSSGGDRLVVFPRPPIS